MPLDEQIHIHTVDTSAFYYDDERQTAAALSRYRKLKESFKKKYPGNYFKELRELVGSAEDYKAIKKTPYPELRKNKVLLFNDYSDIWETIVNIKKKIDVIKHINIKIEHTKNKLIKSFKARVAYNNEHEDKSIRTLNPKVIGNWNCISVFESSLTRTIGAKTDEICDDIMVVRIYYFDVLEDLVVNGYNYNGEHYVYFSSSAGQIRTKKTVFIKESTFKQHEKTLMCGLTVDKINAMGGMNTNKYLAYLALNNSASDLWEDFDIDKAIVVDDLETNVTGVVDFIDDVTYNIERKKMDIPITHTDGCGMIRGVDSNFTVRLPWIKGLLAAWDFIDFIKEYNGSYIIKDIYGDTHDLLAEDIQVIFTRSQFKAWKFYKNWDEYKQAFRSNNCQASICCEEEGKIPYSTINYQMLQTLTDVTDDEIGKLVKKSNSRINDLTGTIEEMLKLLGVDDRTAEGKADYFMNSIKLYPEMLADIYSKETLKSCKKALVNKYKAGKLEINGKYTFLLPDLFAVSERLFLGIKNPKGLLADGEVYCSLLRAGEVDLLRSPHLYKEHAIRQNVKSDQNRRWFKTNAAYTSCHDLISKILQFDVDGDKVLIASDKELLPLAKRNMKGVVPLYYNMKKAEAVQITAESICNGLIAAFVGGNIGNYSNDISKIWNSGEMTEEAEKCVKWLCMENNFTIDYAKTLYKPKRPKYVQNIIQKYTSRKLPHYFVYAKDKKPCQVEAPSGSLVDKLETRIRDHKLFFTTHNLAAYDYKLLMSDPNTIPDTAVTELYESLRHKYNRWARFDYSRKTDDDNTAFIQRLMRTTFAKTGYSERSVADQLVAYAFKSDHKDKNMLWGCYGKYIYENLKRKIDPDERVCIKCGRRFQPNNRNSTQCEMCKNRKTQPLKTKCVDCGTIVIHSSGSKLQTRCPTCYKIYRRNYQVKHLKQQRAKAKNALKYDDSSKNEF